MVHLAGSQPPEILVLIDDARLKLTAHPSVLRYDMVSFKAFSGDGIPSHLLTVEVVDGFLDRLKPGGLVLFHISNCYYDLRTIVKAATALHGLHMVFRPAVKRDSLGPHDNPTAIAVASYSDAALSPTVAKKWSANPPRLDHVELWNDDYLHLLWPLFWRAVRPC